MTTRPFRKRGAFTSKHDALNRAVHVWTCERCSAQHRSTKPDLCSSCGGGAFHHFDSQGEASRFAQLLMLLSARQITELRLQVPFPLYAHPRKDGYADIKPEKLGKPVLKYVADFVYRDRQGRQVVEDFKGHEHHTTDLFKQKRRLIEAAYGVRITITT